MSDNRTKTEIWFDLMVVLLIFKFHLGKAYQEKGAPPASLGVKST